MSIMHIKEQMLLYHFFPVTMVGIERIEIKNEKGYLIPTFKPIVRGFWSFLFKNKTMGYMYITKKWYHIGYFKAVYNSLKLHKIQHKIQKLEMRPLTSRSLTGKPNGKQIT